MIPSPLRSLGSAFASIRVPLGLFLLAQPFAAQVETLSGPTIIDRSCDIRVGSFARGVAQEDGAPLLTLRGDGITVRLLDPLDGSVAGQTQEQLHGVGILVTGKNVTLRDARVRGFKVGIHAREAHGLVLQNCSLERNFAQALASTPWAEDAADWLSPHANDDHEWVRNYGAAIHIERSDGVTVRQCRVRNGQNGLILDRVRNSEVYDNDFSFLSGWGIAMWRASDNIVCRNAVDFCVRGYSHGVYNRGQDSAGILMFEQCERNVIALNSGTHSGDGFFGFAGQEALGEHAPPAGFEYERKGNLDNLLLENDFSYAVAHGIEMTFSFGNVIRGNRLLGNGICGIWGGYSKDTIIVDNLFERNGDMPYGLERGGINIEHGERNRIQENRFVENACGIHLWWDPDEGLTRLPWSKANGHGCGETLIAGNTFSRDTLGVHLRACPGVEIADNRFVEVGEERRSEGCEADGQGLPRAASTREQDLRARLGERELPGKKRAVGARTHLAGRERILMTKWGPYDWQSPLLQFLGSTQEGAHEYRLLGPASTTARAELKGDARLEIGSHEGFPVYRVFPRVFPRVLPRALPGVATEGAGVPRAASYRLRVAAGNTTLEEEGLLLPMSWNVRSFAWTHDPREDLAGWLADAESAQSFEVARLNLAFGNAGPSQLAQAPEALRTAELPRDRFGTLAASSILLPAGNWRLESNSDDGIRVSVDGQVVIEDWTWHAPTKHTGSFTLSEERTVEIRVQHFELDGFALLTLELERAL